MSDLIVPKHLMCIAFACKKKADKLGLCSDHLAVLPGDLRYVYERARMNAKANGRMTVRLRGATEKVVWFLANHDREEALRRKRLTEGRAKEADILAEAEEHIARLPEAPKRVVNT